MKMADELFIGIDGGATKAKGVAMNSQRTVLAEAAGGAANFQVIGVDSASANIHSVVMSILERLNADFTKVQAICLGLAGAGRKDDAEKIRLRYISLLRQQRLHEPILIVESDALTSLEGAFGGKPGMILISGTGSILFAKDNQNVLHRVGGWGRLIGDEGSGYAIGRAGLTAVARDIDGRGPQTSITGLIKSKLGIDGAQSLIVELYQKNLDLASVAPLVVDAAEKGDRAAIDILSRNSAELVVHVRAMLEKLKGPLPLAFVGGVLSGDNIFRRTVEKNMKENFPEIKIQEPEFSPALGAALIALRIGGQPG